MFITTKKNITKTGNDEPITNDLKYLILYYSTTKISSIIKMGGKPRTRAELKELYLYIMKLFIDTEIKFTLFYGSLLGYVRESDFIENDNDIDVLIPRSQAELLVSIIKEKKIRTKHCSANIYQLCSPTIDPFDVYVYDEYIDNVLIKHDGNLLFKKSDVFPLQEITFHDYQVFIPNNSEQILKELYGDWKTPKPRDRSYVPFAGRPKRL
jgi:lipopolysaccharide cholinephosphotransferase